MLRSTTTCPPPAQSVHDTGLIVRLPPRPSAVPPCFTSRYATSFKPFALLMPCLFSLRRVQPDIRRFHHFLPLRNVAAQMLAKRFGRARDDGAALGCETLLHVRRLQERDDVAVERSGDFLRRFRRREDGVPAAERK